MSNEVTLAAETGRTLGSSSSRRLRKAGWIPAVVYGHGMEPLPVSVNGRDLRAALSTDAGLNALITLTVGGDSHLAVAKQLQRSAVRGVVEHVDFQIVRRDEIIAAEVPIHLVGTAEQVIKADGVVGQELNALTVHATPGAVPAAIEVDVTDLEPGGTIRVSDLALPSGVTTDVDPESPVVSATISALEIPEPVAAEEGEGAEGEGAEAGEGETAARDEATAEAEVSGDVDAGGDSAE
jgi:large subunit ribosomal protein L25